MPEWKGIEGLIRRMLRKRQARRWGEGADIDHLSTFVSTHKGVEGYVEPRTMVTETTMVLVADSGEWTRRRVANPRAAQELGKHLGIPVYDVQLVGYPERMRAWNRHRSTKRPLADGE